MEQGKTKMDKEMTTIDEYKEKFIALANQLEKEHWFLISSIEISRDIFEHRTSFGQEYETYHYSCNITT